MHRGAAYAMGTDKHHGRLVIRRSVDSGTTWSDPTVIAGGQWHTAPVPVVEHGGRLWRAVEDAHTSNKWGERYRARMVSIPVGKDLLAWEIRCLLLRHPDVAKHGFQYVAWQFDGDDLIAACRTAWDDAEGGAHNNHDANYPTFHRWPGFRKLTRGDDTPLPEVIPVVHETAVFHLTGGAPWIGAVSFPQPSELTRHAGICDDHARDRPVPASSNP